MQTLKVKDLMLFVSYTARLQFMETERGCKNYKYIFPDDIVTREIIEKCYAHLLDREISAGIHGEGNREGLIIPVYKD